MIRNKSNNKFELCGVQELTQSPLPVNTFDFSTASQCFNDTSSLHDENILSVLSELQIVEQTPADDINDDSKNHQHMFDSTDEEDNSVQQPLIVPVVSDHEEFNNVIETGIGKLPKKKLNIEKKYLLLNIEWKKIKVNRLSKM